MSVKKDTGEFTPEQMARYIEHCNFMEKINAYRARVGSTWGGPPFSVNELKYVRGEISMPKRIAKKSQGQKKSIHKKPLSPFTPKKREIVLPPSIPARLHRDYRIVLNDVWMNAIQNKRISIIERDQFENLINEVPVPCLIRALGRFETAFHNQYGVTLGGPQSMDRLAAKQWLEMWQNVRVMLSGFGTGDLDGGTLWNCLAALALNAGFPAKDWE